MILHEDDETPFFNWDEEIEKWWRNRLADQIESAQMYLHDIDTETHWFNLGMKHAADIIRHARDDLGWSLDD